MSFSFKILGTLEITENGRLSPLMKSRKGSALLTYLIVTGQTQPRLHVADLLWEATSTSNALRNLRRLLGVIRKQVPELVITNQTLSFQPRPTTHVDYQQLQEALDQADVLADRTKQQQLDDGLQFYRGDLLTTFYLDDAPYFNEWLTLTRERLRQEVFAAYHRLCVAYHEAEAWELGVAAARRWLALDDLYEETYRWLIRFLAASGQVAAAQAQYEACRSHLWEELGVEPEMATQQLAEQLGQAAVSPASYGQPPAAPWQPDPLPDPTILASLGNLPPHSLLPYQRNPDFTGRENELVALGQRLLPWEEEIEIGAWRLDESPNPQYFDNTQHKPLTSYSQSAAITGMGGLGKTQLAVEFAYRYGRFFEGGVYWLNFAQANGVAEEVAAVGSERGMRLFQEADKLTLTDRVGRVQQAWQEATPRLLIFDNCEDEALLQTWLPVSGGCRVLLTSRRSDWARELGIVTYSLKGLARDESCKLLYRLAAHTPASDAAYIAEIADNLGDLPLALQLAGNFLHRYQRITPMAYLQQLERVGLWQHPSLQGRGSTLSPTHHELNIARTFALNFEQLDSTVDVDVIARRLLANITCFAPGEPIPIRLLLATMQQEGNDLMAELLAEDGLARILSLGFVRTTQKEKVVMHRLLVQFTQAHLPVDEVTQTAVAETVAQAVQAHLSKTGGLFTLPLASAHLHHVIHVAKATPNAVVTRLAKNVCYHSILLADYETAQKYIELAVSIDQALYGLNDRRTARSMMLMAINLRWVASFQEAWALFQQALAIHEELLDPQDLDLATSLNNTGFFLIIQGGYQQALPYIERALVIRKQSQNQLTVAMSEDLLGVIFLKLGNLEAAKALLMRTLAIREQAFTADHPLIASTRHNLGCLFTKLHAYDEAQANLEKALAIRQKMIGKTHLYTTNTLTALGNLYFVQGRMEKARAFFEQAITIHETHFAKKQPEMADALTLMGELHWAKGQQEQARPFYEQALAILEETAVPEHPDFPLIRERLTMLRRA